MHLWGKTADEVLALTRQPQQPQSQQPPAPQPTPAQPLGITNENYFDRPFDNTKAVATRVVEEMAAARFQPLMQQTTQTMASAIRGMAAQKNPAEFTRWGGEIDAAISGVDPAYRTLDLYEKAVTLVKGQHVAEIVQEERAKWQTGLDNPGERSAGGGAPFASSARAVDMENLPPQFKEVCKQAGVTESSILEFCKASDTPVEQWVEMVKSDKAFAAVAGQAPSGKMAIETQLTNEKLGIKASDRWRA